MDESGQKLQKVAKVAKNGPKVADIDEKMAIHGPSAKNGQTVA